MGLVTHRLPVTKHSSHPFLLLLMMTSWHPCQPALLAEHLTFALQPDSLPVIPVSPALPCPISLDLAFTCLDPQAVP